MELSLTYSAAIDVAYSDVKSSTRKAQQALWIRFMTWILKGIQRRLVRDFTRINTEFEGLLNMISERQDVRFVEQDYIQFKEIVSLLTFTNEKYREMDYIGSSQLKEVMNSTLTLAYEIEAELKIAAKKGQAIIPTDAEYKKAMSMTSNYAISKKLSHSF